MHSLLLVDDEVDNVDALERLFRKKYEVHKATSGKKALEILKAHPDISLIVTDQRMPEMNGVEFLSRAIKIQPEAIRILLTGYTDIESVIGAVNSGEIYRYLTKPWDPVDLVNTVAKALEKLELKLELKQKNQELEKALAELQTLDKSKTDFMLLINHELKTPLTGITSFLQILNETKLSEEQSLYTDRIEKNVSRLQRLVNDTLFIVSAETGQHKVKKSKNSIETLLAIPSEIQANIDKKKQSLEVDTKSGNIQTDKELFKEVFRRLLENASKFGSEKGAISVTVAETGNDLVTTIENEGPVIAKAKIESLLKPFALNENSLNHTAGTGLGLTVCQAILKSLGGGLSLAPMSKGLRVSFTVPRS